MEESIGRRRVARAYTWLMAVVTVSVVVLGFLFSAFYSQGDTAYRDAHGIFGSLVGLVLLVVLVPLAFTAKFPKRMRIGWWTVGLAVLWNVQAHAIGYGIGDARWLEMVHIPLAFLILGLGAYLAGRAYVALREGGSDAVEVSSRQLEPRIPEEA